MHSGLLLQVDEPSVWSELGHAQLEAGLVGEAIASYLRSNDSSRHVDVVERCKEVRWSCGLPAVVIGRAPEALPLFGDCKAECCLNHPRAHEVVLQTSAAKLLGWHQREVLALASALMAWLLCSHCRSSMLPFASRD